MHWFVEAFRKYADFSGRARRIEYWMFHLFNWIALVLLILVLMPGSSAPSEFVASFFWVYALAVILPSFAVAIRRMHDTDHSGWWIMVPVANFVLTLLPGTSGPNRFGPDPKAEHQLA